MLVVNAKNVVVARKVIVKDTGGGWLDSHQFRCTSANSRHWPFQSSFPDTHLETNISNWSSGPGSSSPELSAVE